MGQAAVEFFIPTGSRGTIIRGTLQRCGNGCTVRSFKEDRDKTGIRGALVVNMLVDQIPFPPYTKTCVCFFFTHHPAKVGWRADHEYKISRANLMIHPAWPAFGR